MITDILLARAFSLILVVIHRRLEGKLPQFKRGTENSENFEEMSQKFLEITGKISCLFLTVSFSRTALSVRS